MVARREKKTKKSIDSESLEQGVLEKGSKKKPRSVNSVSSGKSNSSAAPFALLISFLLVIALGYSFLYRPASSLLIPSSVKDSIRINLDLTSSEFATEGEAAGSLDICKGSKSFPDLNKAVVKVLSLKDEPLGAVEVKEASSKVESTCKYKLDFIDVPKLEGTKLKFYVSFPFGDSGTFTLDVGKEPPYSEVNIRLTLG